MRAVLSPKTLFKSYTCRIQVADASMRLARYTISTVFMQTAKAASNFKVGEIRGAVYDVHWRSCTYYSTQTKLKGVRDSDQKSDPNAKLPLQSKCSMELCFNGTSFIPPCEVSRTLQVQQPRTWRG